MFSCEFCYIHFIEHVRATVFLHFEEVIAQGNINPFVPDATFPYPLKVEGFLMFSGGRERVHWEQMG